jgi:hypothetical protein
MSSAPGLRAGMMLDISSGPTRDAVGIGFTW